MALSTIDQREDLFHETLESANSILRHRHLRSRRVLPRSGTENQFVLSVTATICKSVELAIDSCYGDSPAICELHLYCLDSLN